MEFKYNSYISLQLNVEAITHLHLGPFANRAIFMGEWLFIPNPYPDSSLFIETPPKHQVGLSDVFLLFICQCIPGV